LLNSLYSYQKALNRQSFPAILPTFAPLRRHIDYFRPQSHPPTATTAIEILKNVSKKGEYGYVFFSTGKF
jgi:hypothetical protein